MGEEHALKGFCAAAKASIPTINPDEDLRVDTTAALQTVERGGGSAGIGAPANAGQFTADDAARINAKPIDVTVETEARKLLPAPEDAVAIGVWDTLPVNTTAGIPDATSGNTTVAPPPEVPVPPPVASNVTSRGKGKKQEEKAD